jgi:hypothetical protein
MQNMNNVDLGRMTPMTLDRAREIVAHVEDEFATGCHIEDAFMPFSGGGATTYVVIADYFRLAYVRRSESPDAMREFDKYANSSEFIAMRIMSDNIRDPSKLRDANGLGSQETVSSFVGYLRTLDPTAADFWHNVYQRIGLAYPLESQPLIQAPEQSARTSKPWWRLWKK